MTPPTDAAHAEAQLETMNGGYMAPPPAVEILTEALYDCMDALKSAEQYLVERGIEQKGTIGRTQVLPRIRSALTNAMVAVDNAEGE